jgi:hypothetical protein
LAPVPPAERNRRCGARTCTVACSAGPVPSVGCACAVGRGGTAQPAVAGPARGYHGSVPTTLPRAPRRLLALAVAPLAAAAALAGCGASTGAGATDPAGLVPASAPVYLEAVLRPDDQEAGDARTALGKILRTSDPGAKLTELIDRGGQQAGIRFAEDIEPWLGDRVGVAVLSFARERADTVAIAASTDNAKAQAAIDKLQAGGDKRTYRDVEYTFDADDDTAAAVVGDAVVIGTEPGLKGAIDASKGSSLAEADALKKARATVSQERSGFAYLDVAGVLRQAVSAAGDTAAQAAPLLDPVAKALPKTVAAALDAEPDLLRVDSASFGQPASARPAKSGADALAALPAGAWLGVGAGELGQTLTNFLDTVSSGGGLAGVGIEALLGQLQQSTGLDLRKDVLAWMGDAGFFVAGTNPDDARGALVIASKDPAATRRTVQTLRRLLGSGRDVRELSAPGVDEGFLVRGDGGRRHDLLVAAGGSKFVVAVGRRALEEALDPGATLGSAATFTDAAGKLGGGVRPSFFVDVERLTTLLDAKKGSRFDHAKPYFEAFGVIVGGSRQDGDIGRGRAIATLK